MAVAVAMAVLACVAATPAATNDDEAFLALIAKYEQSQNNRDVNLLQQLVTEGVEVWLPAGQGSPVLGQNAAVKFFIAFFGSFAKISEVVNTRIVSGTAAATAKTFNAVAANGCAISLPVLQTFESPDGLTLSSIRAVWNTTLFQEQFACHK